MRNLVLFGDSLLANINKPTAEKIEVMAGVDLYNCATCGWDSSDGALKAPYIAILKPDVVLFSFGMNDSAPWKKVEIAKFKENLGKIYDAFQGADRIFFTPPPIREDRQVGEQKRTNNLIGQYSAAVKDFARSKNAKFIDSWYLLKPSLDAGKDYHDEDGVHFNDLGYEILAHQIGHVVND